MLKIAIKTDSVDNYFINFTELLSGTERSTTNFWKITGLTNLRIVHDVGFKDVPLKSYFQMKWRHSRSLKMKNIKPF